MQAQQVQTYGRKKTATAVAHAKRGTGLLKLNGSPIALVTPEILREKVQEPVLVLGKERLSMLDIRVRVSGGGQVSQVYAVRQAIAKGTLQLSYYPCCIESLSQPITYINGFILHFMSILCWLSFYF